MSDVHVDPTFPVVEDRLVRAERDACQDNAELRRDILELQADRARLEQENARLHAITEQLGGSLSRTRQLLDAAQADRNGWRIRADEAAATLRAYRMGTPDLKYSLAMSAAVAQRLQEGIPVLQIIVGLCEAASIPMPRVPLTREQAVALSQKHADRAAQGLCENWGDAAIDAIIEASK